jgi:carbon-monoxide dehydrogenase medium subunit
MKPAPFDYVVPDSVPATLNILAEQGYDAKVLAGGQSLVPAMNFRLVQPSILVDINRLEELDFVRPSDDGGLRIGALARHRKVENSPLVRERAPLMYEAMPHIAHPQIRTRGTMGGSLAHADPAAELPVVLVALDGRLVIRNQLGTREVSAGDFFQGLFVTALEPDDLLVEVMLPRPARKGGYAFVEFSRRRGDYALLGVAACLELANDGSVTSARLVYLNAGDMPIVAVEAAGTLIGHRPGAAAFEEAAQVAAERELRPVGNIHASVPYLRSLARVLTKRALETAAKRANRSSNPQ